MRATTSDSYPFAVFLFHEAMNFLQSGVELILRLAGMMKITTTIYITPPHLKKVPNVIAEPL